MHYLTCRYAEGQYKVGWYCWHLSREFFEALDKHGLPPTRVDYNELMDTLAENQKQRAEINTL